MATPTFRAVKIEEMPCKGIRWEVRGPLVNRPVFLKRGPEAEKIAKKVAKSLQAGQTLQEALKLAL
jgi:hypothetical protein